MEDFRTYPDNAKTWIYQSSRFLDEDEIAYIKVVLDEFISTWESHGSMLTAAYEVFDNLFIVLFVDEQGDAMCGRAQDASVKVMKELEAQLETTLLDRMVQAYKKDGKVIPTTLAEFSKLIEDKEIDENTIVFNHTVTNKRDFGQNWEVPLKDSWHKQLLVVNN